MRLHKNIHRPSFTPLHERRLCREHAGAENADGKHHMENLMQSTEDTIEDPQEFGNLVNHVHQRIDASFDTSKCLPEDFRISLKSNIALFMKASIGRFSGQDRTLSVAEFEVYRTDVIGKIEEILHSIDNKGEELQKTKEEKDKKLKS